MTDKVEQAFTAYVSELQYAGLSLAAIHWAKRNIVDSIGCAFGAFHEGPARAIRRLAAQFSSVRPASVIGTDFKTSPDMAALANGGMIRYLDFSDDYFGGNGDIGPHPSDNIAGILAAVQAAGADGKIAILGIVTAYEACGQLVNVLDLRGVKRTWDYPVLHSISTALGAGKVFGLSQPQLRDALALSVVPNICINQTRNGQLSSWKGFAGPNGSRAGLFAAMLAREGMSGPEDVFEGRAGLMKHLNIPFELGAFGGNGGPFKIESTFHKYMPVRYTTQLPIWTAFELRKEVNPTEIADLRMDVPRRYAISKNDYPEYWDPRTSGTADHSVVYLIAAALVDGEITEKTFTPARFRDPQILALMQTIHMSEDPQFSAEFPRTFNCRFTVTLSSGKVVTLHKTNPKGHPANPLSESEIEDKFLRQSDKAGVPRPQARELLDRLWQLDKEPAIEPLFKLMYVPDSREA